MAGTLAHRGPDDHRVSCEPHLGLGFRRLSIIDLAGGIQPITNEDRSLVMVCNGEIFNYRALREELAAQGHHFRTEGDVEVLLHLYEEKGADFLESVNGQFAVALYDRREQKLVLARDPVGIAPLFYTQQGDEWLFASEIKALLAHPQLSPRVDLTGLDQMLTLPGTVSPRTLFEGVHSVPPGHILTFRNQSVSGRAYWDLDYPQATELDPAKEPDFDDLESRLKKAVEDRLQAEVQVGCYLSGGLDSSLIGALIHQCDTQKGAGFQRHAFSIGFQDDLLDERRFQKLVAEQMQAIHHTLLFDSSDLEKRLRQAVYHAETPLRESYNTCSLALSESVRAQGIKVILTGEGADELFGGYVGYRLDSERHLQEADDFSLEAQLEREQRVKMWGDDSVFYEKNYTTFAEVKSALYAPDLARQLPQFDCSRAPLVDPKMLRGRHPMHQRSYLDFKLRLADHLLADHGDRVSLANSVEARFPFLDRSVIDWVRQVAPQWLIHEYSEKYPLRKIAAKHVPTAILNREKFAFVAPSCAVLLQSKASWVEDLLDYDRIKAAGYFNAETVERLKQQYRLPGFRLNTTFDVDLLMIVLTFEILRESFSIPTL
jgi:asparagine synthase (glutamine-hydrolysing)